MKYLKPDSGDHETEANHGQPGTHTGQNGAIGGKKNARGVIVIQIIDFANQQIFEKKRPGLKFRAWSRNLEPRQCDQAGYYWLAEPRSCRFFRTSSRLNVAAFWRWGYSLKVARKPPTYSWAGTMRKA